MFTGLFFQRSRIWFASHLQTPLRQSIQSPSTLGGDQCFWFLGTKYSLHVFGHPLRNHSANATIMLPIDVGYQICPFAFLEHESYTVIPASCLLSGHVLQVFHVKAATGVKFRQDRNRPGHAISPSTQILILNYRHLMEMWWCWTHSSPSPIIGIFPPATRPSPLTCTEFGDCKSIICF